MGPLRIIAFSNLRRQKTQSALTGLGVAIAAFLASLALSLLLDLRAPYQRMVARLSGSHISYALDRKFYDLNALRDWWKARPGTADCSVTPMAYVAEGFNVLNGSRKVSQSTFLAEYDPPGKTDRLEILEGASKAEPGPGEAWLPNVIASAQKLKVGDEIEMPSDEGMSRFTVSAIVLDPVFSASGMMNPSRMWVGRGELAFHYAPESLRWSFLRVRLSDPAALRTEMDAFTAFLGGGVNGIVYDYAMMQSAFSTFFSIFSISLAVLAALTLVIAAFSAYASISGSVAADFRRIGILKSLGFTPGSVVALYALQYLIVAAIAVPPAIIASFFTNGYLRRAFLDSVGAGGPAAQLFLLLGGSLLFFLALVPAMAALFARKAGSITAVEAIRLGESSRATRQKTPLALRRALSPPLILTLAAKQAFFKKRRGLANGFSVFFAGFIILFGLDMAAFMSTAARFPPIWGTDASDVTVIRSGKRFKVEREQLWTELARDERVLMALPTGFTSISMPAAGGRPSTQLVGTVLDGDFDQAGYRNVAGRSPKTPREISLAYNSFRTSGVKLGGQVSLAIAGQRLDYALVGYYQSTNNFGQGFRMIKAGWERGDPSYRIDSANVFLRPGVKAGDFIDSTEARYGEAVDAMDTGESAVKAISQITGLLSSAFLFFTLVIVASSFAIIFNNTAMELLECRRAFGTYKTLGMTPGELRSIMCLKNAMIGLAAGVAGCLSAGIAQRPLARLAFSVLGLRQLDLPFSVPGALAAVLGLCAFAGFAAWIPSRAVKSLNVRELIVE